MKKYLSVLIAIFVFSAFPSVLDCRCAGEDCGVSKMIRAEVPQCHLEDSPAKGEDPSRKDCCAQCLIERAELSSKKLTDSVIRQEAKAVPAFCDTRSVARSSKEIFASSRSLQIEKTDFFTGYVFNTTFAFRGPPAG